MPKCKSCGAPIHFIKMKSGANMPVEKEMVKYFIPAGNHADLVKGWLPHWGNCPGADKHRKPKITKQEIGPLTERGKVT